MIKDTLIDNYSDLQKEKSIISLKVSTPNIINGITGSSLSFHIASAFKNQDEAFLLVCDDKEEAAYYANDLEVLVNKNDVLFYPGSYRRPYQIEETNNANILLRSEVLNRINSRKRPPIIVTYPQALFEKVVTKSTLNQSTLKIAVGDLLSIDFVNEVLFEYHFKRVDFVTEPGEFSLRGGILDVFSFANDKPYRIEFFGDEVDSLREFDIETQLSCDLVKKISIIPNMANKKVVESRQSFLKFLTSKSKVFIKNAPLLYHKLDQLFAKAQDHYKTLNSEISHQNPEALFCNGEFIREELSNFKISLFKTDPFNSVFTTSFNISPQPAFNKQFHLLIEELNSYHDKGYKNLIACVSEQQAKRFQDIFNDMEETVHYECIVLSLFQGFIDHDLKLVCFTDHQIFDRYHKFHIKDGFNKKQALTLKELNTLEIGDYVTHIDHGIGKFGGLQKIDVEGQKQEAIKLIYGERDILYLSIHSLHKITKFNGKDGKAPKVYKLGSKAWKTLKQKTKSRVKEIAFNLIQLYAKRKTKLGFQYSPDSYLQHELEASFLFEDTPDQITATADVKTDMESERPMDRLICGDVGFGKTEVAVRAAFKAVDNSKQVAILVPTTILAYQHYKTFSQRLKDLPVNIDYLNRFRSAKDKKLIIEKLKAGQLDILIGTHQIVNKNVKFNDLGLLIVDEEQKFGVSVKDKLKTLKENVDVLTLTATPIPRTLQFSLMAARDLSVITTPPPNRYPIESKVIRFNEEVIRDAVSYEIQRGGQVFFIHNRIDTIKEIAGLIQRLVPDAKIKVGHGQMEGKKLEDVMLSFMNGTFDVLVSTTIIESGLDVPNANTIFINHANNFGLSDLHQMRGRVGRSNKKAFCYFITPEYSLMTEEARKRISALEQYTELGSGFNIAMKDLEIRGAGDLLGGEQSGFISDIGFDTYQKILNEAIEELKENEFKALYEQDENKIFIKDITIDTDIPILFPDDYINNIKERLHLYTKLNTIKEENELKIFEKELTDRFGKLPTPAVDLLNSLKLKWYATALGFEKLILKQEQLICYFISDQQSAFFQSTIFTSILRFMQTHPHLGKMKEKQTRNGLRLLINFKSVKSVSKANQILKTIIDSKD